MNIDKDNIDNDNIDNDNIDKKDTIELKKSTVIIAITSILLICSFLFCIINIKDTETNIDTNDIYQPIEVVEESNDTFVTEFNRISDFFYESITGLEDIDVEDMDTDNKNFEYSCKNNQQFLENKQKELESIKNNTSDTELKYIIYDLEQWLKYSIGSYGYLQLASMTYHTDYEKFSEYSTTAKANLSLQTEKLDEISDAIFEIKRKINVEYNK